MREELADRVHPVLLHGLQLKRRLAMGEMPNFDMEQATLRQLLLTDAEARRDLDFGGDADARSSNDPAAGESGRRDQFAGARYALVCWLDEIFVLDSPWETAWNERKLEVSLYGSNDRAWKFWEQVRRAELLPNPDALECFFLCVMLGFRGELREAPAKVRAWLVDTQAHLVRARGQSWNFPPGMDPTALAPPLHGTARFQQMAVVWGAALLAALPIVSFWIVSRFGRY